MGKQLSVDEIRDIFAHLRLALSLTEQLIFDALTNEKMRCKFQPVRTDSAPRCDGTRAQNVSHCEGDLRGDWVGPFNGLQKLQPRTAP